MKIAIPSDNKGLEGNVHEHFGRSPKFVLAEIRSGKIVDIKVIDNPIAESHSPGELPELLKNYGVEIVVCHKIGRRAREFLGRLGIKVIDGLGGPIKNVLKFIVGNVTND